MFASVMRASPFSDLTTRDRRSVSDSNILPPPALTG
jgi:hypothetical protein